MARKRKINLFLLGVAIITDVFDYLNLVGVSTIFGYAVTKPISITLNFIFLYIYALNHDVKATDLALFVGENLPALELLPVATYMVLRNR